jgi:hypothetical protein
MAEKQMCRWCGNEIRKSTRAGKSTLRHVEDDNGQCEARRARITGDPKTPIEVA